MSAPIASRGLYCRTSPNTAIVTNGLYCVGGGLVTMTKLVLQATVAQVGQVCGDPSAPGAIAGVTNEVGQAGGNSSQPGVASSVATMSPLTGTVQEDC